MMQVRGLIATTHEDAPGVAASLAPDNLRGMTTTADGNRVHHRDRRHAGPVGHRIRG